MDELYIFLLVALFIHGFLFFLDSCSHYPYIYFLQNTGLQIAAFRINWRTCVFNRQIQKWSAKRPKLQSAWFYAGTLVSLVLMPVGVCLILHTTYAALKNSWQEEKTGLLVEPLVPGWNLPSSDYGYYVLTLLISTLLHEIGHAIAAVREGIHLDSFTFTIFFVVPIAATHLEKIESISPIRQLKIYCAGVWHNIFLALVAAVIATTLPWLFFPFYNFGTGVQVEALKKGSPITGEGGLFIGDVITQVNNCPVRGSTSWQDCLVQTMHEPNIGFCISDSFIKENDESVPVKHLSESIVECCGKSQRHLCFEYIGDEYEPLPLPQYSCLQARKLIEISSTPCVKPKDCPYPLHCFKPSLDNSTKLVRIYRNNGPVVLFLGNPAEVYHSAKTTDFIVIFKYLPSSIPDGITKLFQFITIFSSGLAIINVIPCFCFDGEHIFRTLVQIFLSSKIQNQNVLQSISLCVNIFGTLTLIIYVLVMLLL